MPRRDGFYTDIFDETRQEDMRTYFRGSLASLGVLHRYRNNTVVAMEEHGGAIGIVMEGKLSKAMVSTGGKEKLLYFLRPGEIFGEMNAMEKGVLNYVIYTKEPSLVSFVSRASLEQVLLEKPEVYRYLIHSMTRKFRIVALQLANNSFNDARGRVAEALIRLSACSDPTDEDMTEGMITTALTQTELAYNVGCSRVTVARVLKSFLDEGLIEKVNRKIVIRDMKTLAGYTDRLQ